MPVDGFGGGTSESRPAASRVLVPKTSKRNAFWVSKTYRIPSGTSVTHDPDRVTQLTDLTSQSLKPRKEHQGKRYGPFETKSAFELAEWYWGSSQKSFTDFEKLLQIFRDPTFSIPDAVDLNWRAAFKALGANREDLSEDDGYWIQDDGWRTTSISIEVPLHKQHRNPGVHSYLAGNFRHRSIMSAIKEKIANAEDSRRFHYQPYRATWKPDPASPEVELYGELYSSLAFRQANEEVQGLPSTALNEGLERVVVALMFWSDATKLMSFGGSTLWPCYMFFGNESKYERCQPSEHLGHQIAYFIKLPDTFKDYLKDLNGGKIPADSLFSHCVRELFQRQWGVLLDDELVDAMINGIVLRCPDGKLRCFYPRIFTYSADYPEKILIAGVRNNGGFPCHRCLIQKCDLSNLGAPTDTERRDRLRSEEEQQSKVDEARGIIRAGYAVDTAQIEALLKPQSLVPVVSTLSSRLQPLDFKLLPSLVVDLLHEFEIGVWKNLFIHLIRLLDAFTQRDGSTLTAELDARYRATPTFGRDTIRKFNANASEMKRKAARDYEDLLQCAIPAFEGLLPEPHNSRLMRLLFICAQWHALAKLRLHHDKTLELLDYVTVRLGAHMRLFSRDTCEKVATRELAKEAEARARHEGGANGKGSATRKPRKLGVFTIKFHVLGDYSTIIRNFGTTDSYSTETGNFVIAWFERTDKKEYEFQLSQIERRQARLLAIRAEMGDPPPSKPVGPNTQMPAEDCCDSPGARYFIGETQNSPIDLADLTTNSSAHLADPYLQDTLLKMKQHLLPRILKRLGFDSPGATEKCQWENVVFHANRLFSHKIMRINYTTYDVQREQDVIHVDTPQCNIMLLLNPEDLRDSEHPYLYARVIGIFHANVSYVGKLPDGTVCYTPHRIDFCWAHWYGFNQATDEFALDRASPLSLHAPEALGFFDPADVLRAVHLIPQYTLGQIDSLLSSTLKWGNKQQPLWNTYFINRFADRDLFMRYQYRMAVGHRYMHDNEGFPRLAPTPTIPSDFDYGVALPGPAPHSDDHGAGALPPPSAQHPGMVPVSEPRCSLAGPSTSSASVTTGSHWGWSAAFPPQAAASDVLGLHGEWENAEGRWGEGEGDELAGNDDEEDLDDEELIAYASMYGL